MRNIGKISETVLKRTVLKAIEQNKVGIKEGASVGADCALLSHIAVATGQVSYEDERACEHAITIACNNLYAGGGIPQSIILSIFMPDTYREIRLKELMRQACSCALQREVKIVGGQTEYVAGLKAPVISVTAFGEYGFTRRDISANMQYDIVMTKWLAVSGTSIIATQKEAQLLKKLPAYYVNDAKQIGQFISVDKESKMAMSKEETVAMHDVAGGGLFTAIWEICERLGVGCNIRLDAIPILQETIEVCEIFDINPYRLRGDGALLIVTEDSSSIIEELNKVEIAATVIGHTTECIDRTVIREDETRYLEPGNGDELYKILA